MKSIPAIFLVTLALACSVCAQAVKISDLPADEQEKFNTAKSAATKAGDANYKEKNTTYRQAYREAMVKADPTIFPILDKVYPLSGKAQMKSSELSPADAEKYKAAQKAAKAVDPTLKDKKAAADQALREVMIKIDKVYPPAASAAAAPASEQAE
jgi:hypothetical protein